MLYIRIGTYEDLWCDLRRAVDFVVLGGWGVGGFFFFFLEVDTVLRVAGGCEIIIADE